MSRGLWFIVSARTRRSLVLLWTALFMCSLLMQYASLASPAPVLATPTGSLFQLEGNAVDDGAGDDWENVDDNNDNAVVSTGILTDTGNRRFTQGSKDTLDMSANSWDTASVPDKDDILHAFAALYDVNGNDTIVFGLDRYANNGDAHAGFWFFQDEITVNANGSFGGHRTPGDVFIVSDFTSGGDLSTIKLYKWTNSGLGSPVTGVECAGGSQNICAIANKADTASPWSYNPKQGANNVFPTASFFEGGIDLDSVFANGAPCFATFLAETRSSTSETAELKNFLAGSFPTCEAPDIETQVQQDGNDVTKINKGESVVDVANLNGTDGPPSGEITFFVCGPTDTAQDCNGGEQLGDPVDVDTDGNDGTATSESFTPTELGWYCFRAEYEPDADAHYLAGDHTNATSECFRVIPADVRINKTPNDGSASAGDEISFTLSWSNVGEGKATGVVVTDPLPDEPGLDWSIDSFTGSGSTCVIGDGQDGPELTCNIGSIPGNTDDHGSVTLTSPTTKASCGVIDNTGKITSANDGTNTNDGQITVYCPDVTVEKTPDNGTVNAGGTATFTIVVTNDGPGRADSVTLDDDLPGGYTWTLGGADAADCSIDTSGSPDTLHCAFGSLEDNETRTITLSAPTTGDDCDVIPNTAVVDAANERDAQADNNSDDGSIDVLCADIDIEKDPDAGTVNAGDPIGFSIVVRNDGDGTATGVHVSDDLPGNAGLAWSIESLDQSDDGASCAITGLPGSQTLTCDDASMASNDDFTVHVVSATTPATCGTVNNPESTVTTGNDGRDTDAASLTVQCPDLEVEKTGNGTIDAGGDAVFTITVTNHGPGVAKDAGLTDQLPAGSWTLGGAAAEDCSISASNLLTCDFDDLADDAVRTITLTLATTADDCGPILNSVTVSATNEPENDQFPNTDADTVTVQCPDLSVLKSGNGPISAGEVAVFTIVVSNAGPGAAAEATLTDQLPSGSWTLGGPDAGDCSISASNLLTCAFGTIDAQDSRTITVSKPSDAGDCDAIPNQVSVAAANEAAEDTGNNSDDATIVVNCPDVTVVKTGNGPISAGEVATFTLTITNLGPGAASDVTLVDDLPDGVVWTLGGPDAGDCSIDTSGDPDVLSCNFGTLGNQGSRTVTLSGETDAQECDDIPNLAAVAASNEAAEDTGNNSDEATIVVDCPTIVITKTADAPVVNAGDQIGFTITVTNTGAGSAFNVTVNDPLPAGLTWTIDADASDPGWTIVDGTLKYGPATLAGNGTDVTVHVVAPTSAANCTEIPNLASVTYSGGAGQDDSVVVVQCPDVTVEKTADNSPILAGEVASYTITVSNASGEGVGTAYNVTLDDDLPAGIAWSENSDACGIVAGQLHCEFGDLAPGASASVTVSGTTSLADCDDLPNLASVAASNEAQEDTANNSDDATVEVRCPEIDLVKSSDDEDGVVAAGQVVTFTILAEVVDGPVTDAVITDELPVGQTYVADSQSSSPAATTFTVSPDGRTLTWTYPSLNDGDPAVTIAYDVTIDADAFGPMTNTAELCVAEVVACESDDETVTPRPGLVIDKTNDAPLETIDLPDGSTIDLPTAEEGSTVEYTLDYTLTGDGVTDAVITDVLPLGVTYVNGSAEGDDQFTFQSYTAATRTLRWTAASVTHDGTVTYQATMDDGAAELIQPLVNVATIDSAETDPDSDDSPVFVPPVPAGATGTPKVTLPPTDTLESTPAPSNPGFSLMLILLALAGFVIVIGLATPVPASMRARNRR